ncbi:MAG: hypothetical protein DMG89_25765 [Acidobacteria bacterium]|nr:MAG: hypothetical protein DMG89_25765 [Acidobacteriota bacterium]
MHLDHYWHVFDYPAASFVLQTGERRLNDAGRTTCFGQVFLALQSGLDHVGQSDTVCNFRVDDRG